MVLRRAALVCVMLFFSQLAVAQDTKPVQERHKKAQDELEKEEQKRQGEQPPPPKPEEQPPAEGAPEQKAVAPGAEGTPEPNPPGQEQGQPAGEIQPPEQAGQDQPEPPPLPPPPLVRRHFALGVSLVNELGLVAGMVRFRIHWFAAEVAFGTQASLIFVTGACDKLIVDLTLHTTASVLFFFGTDQRRFTNGIRIGAIYDSRFYAGGLVGWQSELYLRPWLSLQFGAGAQFYPSGDSWAQKRASAVCGNAHITVNPLFTYVQPYLGVGLLFYLF